MVDFFDRLPEYSNTLYLHKKMKPTRRTRWKLSTWWYRSSRP